MSITFICLNSGGRGLFDTPPEPIRGNIENVTDPEHYALGYFGASEISEARLVIKESLLLHI